MNEPITDNASKQRYELAVDGHTAFADYRREDGVLHILYVEAPLPLRGTGAAGRLMQGVMEQAKRDGLKVHPICGYAVSWIARHKEFAALLAG